MIKSGDRLGRFELKEELGRGSHGAVFEAVDVLLGERVAIKALQPWLSGDVTLRERFKRELVLTRRVSHPGVCRLHDLHEEDGVLFISMQFIEGRSLSQLLREALPGPDKAIQWLRGVCSALTAAHAEGVVHRDLKPANIMVTDTERVVVLDFGIATATGVGQLTRPGEAMGSVPYVPPEVWEGEAASAMGDQYALGVTAFVCLTKELPYTGKSPLEVLDAIRGTPATIRSRVADVDLDLEAVILKAMARRPADRFKDIAAFDEALKRVADRRAAGATSTSVEQAHLWLNGPPSSPVPAAVPVDSLKPLPTDPGLQLTSSLAAELAPRSDAASATTTAISPPATPAIVETPASPPEAMPAVEPPPAASPAMRPAMSASPETVPTAEVATPAAPLQAEAADPATDDGDDDALDPLMVPSSAVILTGDGAGAAEDAFFEKTELVTPASFAERTAIVDRRTLQPNQSSAPAATRRPLPLAAIAGVVVIVVIVVGVALSSNDPGPNPDGPVAVVDPVVADPVVDTPSPPPTPPPVATPDVPDVVDPPPPPVPAPPPGTDPAPDVAIFDALDTPAVDDAPEPEPEPDPDPSPSTARPKPISAGPIDAVAQAAAKKGIRPGDVRALDVALTKGRREARRGDRAGLESATKAAKAALDGTAIDKAFVSDKLGRFNKAFDALTDDSVKVKVKPIAREALGRISKGDWDDANRRLNEGLSMMAKARRK